MEVQKLKDQVAVVTGGASGLGKAIVERFRAEGARVACVDLRPGEGCDLAVIADVSNSTAVDAAFDEVAAKLGPADVLVTCAGHGGEMGPASELSDEVWDRMIAVHLHGTFYCTRAALRQMQPRRRGAIVHISSVAALRGFPKGSCYAAAKGGIIALTKSVAQEAIADGIRINSIAPGWVDTPIIHSVPKEMLEALVAQVPQGRMGQAEEIASVALFLCTGDSSYVVGQVLSPNGGAWS